jgi:hypothetical protein
MIGGVDHALHLRRRSIRNPDPAPIGFEGSTIEIRESFALTVVGYDDEVPALPVRSGRRLDGDLEALANEIEVDGTIEVEALADRPRRGEDLVRVHRESISLASFGRVEVDDLRRDEEGERDGDEAHGESISVQKKRG